MTAKAPQAASLATPGRARQGGTSPLRPILATILGRLGLGVLTLLVVTVIVFGAVKLLPGDVATEVLGQSATPETLAALRAELKLDDPAIVRYGR